MLAGSLSSTGAFEVFVDGELVFSKLKAGGVPPMDQLLGLLG